MEEERVERQKRGIEGNIRKRRETEEGGGNKRNKEK